MVLLHCPNEVSALCREVVSANRSVAHILGKEDSDSMAGRKARTKGRAMGHWMSFLRSSYAQAGY